MFAHLWMFTNLGQNLHEKTLMSFFNFDVLKWKPTKFIWTMPWVKFQKICFWGKFLETNKKYDSYGLMKMWSNYDHWKVPNYGLARVTKERAFDMNYHFNTY